MPVDWEVRGNVLVVRFAGDFGVPDIEKTRDEVKASPAFRPGLKLLLDARRSEAPTTTTRMQSYTAMVGSLRGLAFERHWAIVPKTGSAVRFGMARVLASYLSMKGIEMLVTTSFEDALAALAEPAARQSHG